MSNRFMLITCSHFNREGEISLRASIFMLRKYPRNIFMCNAPMIEVTPLIPSSYGVQASHLVAVNGCNRRCVDKILKEKCNEVPGISLAVSEECTQSDHSTSTFTSDDVEKFVEVIEKALGLI